MYRGIMEKKGNLLDCNRVYICIYNISPCLTIPASPTNQEPGADHGVHPATSCLPRLEGLLGC